MEKPQQKKRGDKNYGGGHITEVLLLRPKPLLGPVPGKFLGIAGQDPSDSKIQLVKYRHLPVFDAFIHLRYIL